MNRDGGWDDSSDWIIDNEPVIALMALVRCHRDEPSEHESHEAHSWYALISETVSTAGATVLRSSTIEWRWCDGVTA